LLLGASLGVVLIIALFCFGGGDGDDDEEEEDEEEEGDEEVAADNEDADSAEGSKRDGAVNEGAVNEGVLTPDKNLLCGQPCKNDEDEDEDEDDEDQDDGENHGDDGDDSPSALGALFTRLRSSAAMVSLSLTLLIPACCGSVFAWLSARMVWHTAGVFILQSGFGTRRCHTQPIICMLAQLLTSPMPRIAQRFVAAVGALWPTRMLHFYLRGGRRRTEDDYEDEDEDEDEGEGEGEGEGHEAARAANKGRGRGGRRSRSSCDVLVELVVIIVTLVALGSLIVRHNPVQARQFWEWAGLGGLGGDTHGGSQHGQQGQYGHGQRQHSQQGHSYSHDPEESNWRMYREDYEKLGLDRTSCSADVKSAFRKLAVKWHPDKCATKTIGKQQQELERKECQKVFTELHASYERLMEREPWRHFKEAREKEQQHGGKKAGGRKKRRG
jgi:hypothetical protein